MSAHDSHAPAQETKGIWALPLTAWIIVLLLLVAFTRPIFHHEESAADGHEKTEASHSEHAEPHH
ncbi:hypothetical protein [Pedobacter frigidisoli]|uniref:hypothetical protein n=1 Tax=Pedobacter frigidisoli TaxID=2530455 RepID=UPI002931E5CA|nr:hypothetical protein [Pedobacter frigidisoli]